MILTDNIVSFLPQRAPFVLVDELLEVDCDFSKTCFDIQKDHLFVSNNVLTEPGIIENMAQTAAAGIGYRTCEEDKDVVGFIGAIKSLIIDELPMVGEQITTEVCFINKRLNAYIVEAKLFLHDRIIASCKLNLFVQPKS